MAFATTEDGVRLHYRLDGPEDAPALMLSNSLGTDLELWSGLAPALAREHRLLRYDARGHGRSDVPAGEYALETLARDALGLLDHLGLRRVRFCGLSMGGAVGQWLGAHAPERLERLVLANTGAVFGTPQLWQQRLDTVLREGMGSLVDGVVERWFTEGFRAAHPAEVERTRAMVMATPAQGYAGCCAALRDTDLRRYLPQVAVPTLVIGGLHDSATPPERAQELADGIPGARLAMLDAAHLSVVEQPEAFGGLLQEFLD
jgi:3-oxoadipate enol-lactonase